MKHLHALFILLLCLPLFAHDVIIKGHVYDAVTNKPIEAVNIYVKDKPQGTTSLRNGLFELTIRDADNAMDIIFSHVSYDTLNIKLGKALLEEDFYLQPRLMEGEQISVRAKKKSRFEKDIPQTIIMIDAKDIEGRGYVDVGDLLRVEQSVQIEEDLSGKKTVSLRGGNPEDVVVFYNGVKMNSTFDNVFDFSLLDIEDIERIEIIKGSNTALYGSEAFSGVINIVPKTQPDYRARFVQKFGSYDSGDWNLQLNHTFDERFFVSLNHKEGASRRLFENGDAVLENAATHNSATLYYDMRAPREETEQGVSVVFLRADLSYDNGDLLEEIDDLNQLVSLRYSGDIGPVKRLEISAAHQELDNRQKISLSDGVFDRQIDNANILFNFQKSFLIDNLEIITSYQREDGGIDYNDKRRYLGYDPLGFQKGRLVRARNSLVALLKYDASFADDILEDADLDFSYRYDHVADGQEDALIVSRHGDTLQTSGLTSKRSWDENTLKFSFRVGKEKPDLRYSIFLNTGTNVRFPTLFNQISSPSPDINDPAVAASLIPEKNHSSEVGIEITRSVNEFSFFERWHLLINYFRNTYDNKFRTYYVPNTPIAFYDNVKTASISGFEVKSRWTAFREAFAMELAMSRYNISEKAAFPMKSDIKYTARIDYAFADYAIKLYWYNASEQVGWFRDPNNRFFEVQLPGYSNVDVHLNKAFRFSGFMFRLNASAQNLLSDGTVLNGIAIRDRRYYVGFEIRY